ncbi:MAG TPA: tripartite tricarboxylate transporter substrate binding protein [Burkholderiales bacterium]|jgi:tripartite-type tricarboxylate transporter receptor subunit TctC|nr:tripartite tricarboxylate transporter substrate binding protein [Burkholderiales bacterium]
MHAMNFPKCLAALLCAMIAASAPARADYPDRVVTLVVPFTSGSGSDIIARIVGPRLSERWHQPVVVDNKPGASGNIGADAVAKAVPNGYTLLMAINTLSMAPNLYKKPPFDPAADFAPVMKLAVANFCMVANPGLQANDMAGLLALARKQPGQLNYASPGNGTPHHLAMELLKLQTGVNLTHVPYKGIAGATTDLVGGQVQVMFASLHSVLPQVKAGKLKLLGVTGERSPLTATVAPFRDQGMGFLDALDAWYALFAPAKTPPELIVRLHQDMSAVLAVPEVREQLAGQGLMVQTSSPEQLGALMRTDLARWRKVIADAKIVAD